MPADAARAKSAFLAASELSDPAARAAYLDRECAGAADLRARVEALLRADGASPPPDRGGADATGALPADAPSTATFGTAPLHPPPTTRAGTGTRARSSAGSRRSSR